MHMPFCWFCHDAAHIMITEFVREVNILKLTGREVSIKSNVCCLFVCLFVVFFFVFFLLLLFFVVVVVCFFCCFVFVFVFVFFSSREVH